MSVLLIAEAGVNHNGNAELAHQLVDAAAQAGVDAVKFQTFVPEQLASSHARKADYQERNLAADGSEGNSQLQMLQRLALEFPAHHELLTHCRQRGIAFLSSPFDATSATFLIDDLQLPTIKLGSGELTNGPLLWQLARSGRRLILSTGMATMDEVREALGLLCHATRVDSEQPQTSDFAAFFEPGLLDERVTLLHCTTEYPCPLDSVNLRAMDTLGEAFGLPVGYSDHTRGINVSLAAAARGAAVIEKHFTLDRSLPGPDHAASLEPAELNALVLGVREIETALGSPTKAPADAELANAQVARKSLCALRDIGEGDSFSADNLGSKRPGSGISPMHYWSVLGLHSSRAYARDDIVDRCDGPLAKADKTS